MELRKKIDLGYCRLHSRDSASIQPPALSRFNITGVMVVLKVRCYKVFAFLPHVRAILSLNSPRPVFTPASSWHPV